MRTALAVIGVVATVAIALAWQSAPLHRRLDRIDAHLIAVIERLTALEHRIAVLELHNPPPGGRPAAFDPEDPCIISSPSSSPRPRSWPGPAPSSAQEPAGDSVAARVERELTAVGRVLERAGVGPIVEGRGRAPARASALRRRGRRAPRRPRAGGGGPLARRGARSRRPARRRGRAVGFPLQPGAAAAPG